MRIVSLLPSATEIVCSLGLEEQLVGVTHECDFPPGVRTLPKVTTTLVPTDVSGRAIDAIVRDRIGAGAALYSLDLEALERLRPDLIVTQTLCNVCAVAEDEVRDASCALPTAPTVLNLEPQTLDQVLASIGDVGRAVGVRDRARQTVGALRRRIDAVVSACARERHRPRVALLEWLDPPFSTGHWNPELVRMAGGVDGLGREGQPSVTLEWSQVIAWQPEVVVISCCGFTAERAMEETAVLRDVPGWSELPAVRAGRVWVTDGASYFSRPGPRLVDSLELLGHVLHPASVALPSWVQSPVPL